MKKTKIQIELFAALITQKEISQKIGLSQNCVLNTVAYRYRNKTVQDYIAERLGEDPEILWGVNYAPVWRQNKKNQTTRSANGLAEIQTGGANGSAATGENDPSQLPAEQERGKG